MNSSLTELLEQEPPDFWEELLLSVRVRGLRTEECISRPVTFEIPAGLWNDIRKLAVESNGVTGKLVLPRDHAERALALYLAVLRAAKQGDAKK